MAFNNSTQAKNKNQFVARLISRKSGKTASWINVTDEFSKTVFGAELRDVTAEDALVKLPALFNNQYLEVAITDLTAELTVVEVTEY